jgi:hypothetical protein
MSTLRDITITDRHGGTLALTEEGGMIEVVAEPAEGQDTVEIDETDRRDLADFLNGAR